MPLKLLLLATFSWIPEGRAQYVTAPFTVSQRLMNPAAATTRAYQTVSVAVERSEEHSKVLNITNSSITEDLVIHQLIGHSAFKLAGTWNTELDFAYQQGERSQKNEYQATEGQSQTSKDSVQLAPFQALVARRFGQSLSLGLKGMALAASAATTNTYDTNYSNYKISVDENNDLNAQIYVIGTGFTYKFWNSFFLSYAADFNQFKADRQIDGDSISSTGQSSTQTEAKNVDSSTTRSVRRDMFGASYLYGDPRRNAFRIEISGERITPLTTRSGLKDGQLLRGTMEAQWLYFHLGGEYLVRKGFMIDTFNMIPYFFKFDEFTNQAKTDYGFFGGLRSSKGHSLGAFFSLSTNETQEQLSSTDSTVYTIERKSTAYGVSYGYVF